MLFAAVLHVDKIALLTLHHFYKCDLKHQFILCPIISKELHHNNSNKIALTALIFQMELASPQSNQSSVDTHWVTMDLSWHHVERKGSDQTDLSIPLLQVHTVGIPMVQLKYAALKC